MANAVSPWVGQAGFCLGQARAKSAQEMSSDPANTHQGQQSEYLSLHKQAGYKTATVLATPHISKIRLPHGRRPYKIEMGLFDFLGKKKKEEQDAAELLKAIIQYQVESSKDGVDTDDIPKGYGSFGLCKTNPVPTCGIPGSNEYLSQLRTKDGRFIESSRIGSTTAEDVTSGAIDMYSISSNGVSLGTVYLCPYHRKNSVKAPEGFRLS